MERIGPGGKINYLCVNLEMNGLNMDIGAYGVRSDVWRAIDIEIECTLNLHSHRRGCTG